MTQAILARRDGDTFQARQFWLRAAQLLDPNSPIIRVGFENGPKSFDDIWVEYASSKAPKDSTGQPIEREHIQSKWHTTPGTYGYSDLIDPEFINAQAKSLLERAREAQLVHAPHGSGLRFKLVTNWQLERNDYLTPIISSRSGEIRVNRLYDGTTTDRSRAGKIRKAWREHLDIDNNELQVFVRSLAFGHASESLSDLRERLDIQFAYSGLQRVPASDSVFLYDDLIFEWMSQGHSVFDQDSLKEACASERLLGQSAKTITPIYGVKSFEHAFDQLENRTENVLNFVPAFDQRFIQDDAAWSTKIYPELSNFLNKAATENSNLRLILDTHTTLAFAAGSILNIKSGKAIELEQRTIGMNIWAANDVSSDSSWASIENKVIYIEHDAPDVAVAIGITHEITAKVKRYVKKNLPSIGRLLILQPSIGPGPQAICSGRHAFELAHSIRDSIRSAKDDMPITNKSHLFIAAPNGFTFFLGQQALALGSIELYEYDLEGNRDNDYSLSLTLPIRS